MNTWPTRSRFGTPPALRISSRTTREGTQVVDDGAARVLLEEMLGEERREDVAAHDLGLLIDEDAAVGVAVEAHAKVGGVLQHRFLQLAQVDVHQRVGLVLETAGDLLVDGHDLEIGIAH